MPSVVMNDGTRRTTVTRPLTRPTAAPTRSPATRPSHRGRPVEVAGAGHLLRHSLARAHDLLLARAALEPRLGLVGLDGVLGHEDQARVGVGRSLEPAGQLVEKELEDGVEALGVRLLVDG